MHFAFTAEEELIRATAERLAAERLAPHAAALDRVRRVIDQPD